MTSKPLFIMVALSIVILGPIFQVGCRSASSGVISSVISFSKNGPPEAVSNILSISACFSPRRHCMMALCSLSTVSRVARHSLAASITRQPPATSTSLLASATVFPFWIIFQVGRSPATPTRAETPISKSVSRLIASIPSLPQ